MFFNIGLSSTLQTWGHRLGVSGITNLDQKFVKNLNDLFAKYVRGLVSFSSRFPAEFAAEVLSD